MTGRSVPGACPHDCPDTCCFTTEIEEGRAVAIRGRKDHPVVRGWLCSKVNSYLNHVYNPRRLMNPLRRIGPKGQGAGAWEAITWDEAIKDIAKHWSGIVSRYGPEAILPYSYSGTLGLVQGVVSSARLWNWLGASQLERSICGNAAKFAVRATVGQRASSVYEDALASRLVILWGNNPVVSGPHIVPFLRRARRAGCRLVVVDPVRTATADLADVHIAPRPGTDAALALGMAHIIVVTGQHDEEWLRQNTVGWSQYRDRLADYPPATVAEITGLAAEVIWDLAVSYAGQKPSTIRISDGLQRHLTGGQAVRAICALPAVTGQYGVAGGGLGYSASDEIAWDAEAVEHWAECPPPARVVNMNRLGAALLGEVDDPPIASLFVFGANPVTSSPNAGRIVQGLMRRDLFTVVHELYLTDSTDYADIVLPATSQLEQTDLHKAYGYSALAYNQPAISPLGECKSNWEVMGCLARALDCDRPWMYQTADEVIDDVLAATARRHDKLAGISGDDLRRDGFLLLRHPGETPFSDLRFPTSSGKVELYAGAMEKEGVDPLPGWSQAQDWEPSVGGIQETEPGPLTLISAAGRHFVSSTFGGSSLALRRQGSPRLTIHPDDAAARGIADGDVVMVENARGQCRLLACVNDAVLPGVVASPKGFWSKLDPWSETGSGRNVNWTTSDAIGDVAGQSCFHSNRVWVRRCRRE